MHGPAPEGVTNPMAELRSSNPVFSRGGGLRGRSPGSYAPPSTPTPDQLYRAPSTLTVDDVIMHTPGLFLIVGVIGGIGWAIAPSSPGVGFAAGLVALALALVIAFRRILRPSLVVAFRWKACFHRCHLTLLRACFESC